MAEQGSTEASDALYQLTITLDSRDPLHARFIAAYLGAADGPRYGRFCLLAGYQAASAAPPGILAATLWTGLGPTPAPGNRSTITADPSPSERPHSLQSTAPRDSDRQPGPVGARLFGLD